MLSHIGLTAQDVSRAVVETVARLDHTAAQSHGSDTSEVERSGDAG